MMIELYILIGWLISLMLWKIGLSDLLYTLSEIAFYPLVNYDEDRR